METAVTYEQVYDHAVVAIEENRMKDNTVHEKKHVQNSRNKKKDEDWNDIDESEYENVFVNVMNALAQHPDVEKAPRSILSSLFSTSKKYVYSPTGAKIVRRVKLYPRWCAKRIVESVSTGVVDMEHPLSEDPNGNVLVEMFCSKDRQFLLLQCSRFIGFMYRPVTHPYAYTGIDAESLAEMFLK